MSNPKVRNLTNTQINSFLKISSSMGSLATLPMPGTYVQELKDCGVNERGTLRNELLGCVVTQPSGSQLAIETVFHDNKDSRDDGDLHVVNYKNATLTSYYRGWGTWTFHYGNQHHANKNYLRSGTVIKND